MIWTKKPATHLYFFVWIRTLCGLKTFWMILVPWMQQICNLFSSKINFFVSLVVDHKLLYIHLLTMLILCTQRLLHVFFWSLECLMTQNMSQYWIISFGLLPFNTIYAHKFVIVCVVSIFVCSIWKEVPLE